MEINVVTRPASDIKNVEQENLLKNIGKFHEQVMGPLANVTMSV